MCKKNTLHNLQSAFVATVFDENDTGFDTSIKTNGLSGSRRLKIYHNNIFISLTETLKSVYPVVYRLVGEDFFNYMAREYIQIKPSTTGNLHDFGDHFPAFIADFSAAKQLVYLADVATLEWAYHTVFHAADSVPLDIARLQAVDAQQYGNLKFVVNPASQLIFSDYPILTIWQSNQDVDNVTPKIEPREPEGETINLNDGETRLLVIRRNLDTEFEPLSIAEFHFLSLLKEGTSFSTACESTIALVPDCDVGQIFQAHVLSATLTDFTR